MKYKELKVFLIIMFMLTIPFVFFACDSDEDITILSTDARFIAHRGLSSQFYENTVAAFTAAGQSEFFYGIETDIFQTADGLFVCSHEENPFMNRNIFISDITLEYALSLPLINPQYRIATMEQYLEICKEYGKVAIIELKLYGLTNQLIDEIVGVVESFDMMQQSKFISFSRADIILIKDLYPEASVQILYNATSALDLNYDASINYPLVYEGHIALVHLRGKEIGVWTVNSKRDAKWFIDHGVEYITTKIDFSK